MKALPQGIVNKVVKTLKKKNLKKSARGALPLPNPGARPVLCKSSHCHCHLINAHSLCGQLHACCLPTHSFETLQHNSIKCSLSDTFSSSQGEAGSCTKEKKRTANILQEVWPQDNGQHVSVAPHSPVATSVDEQHREYFKSM